ncbi:hypothetical protein LTS08_006413 [Lithohypha guttulata]|nr:hypothetical protein LTS08_006413 [Lithohypha guttulata]
MSAIPGFGYRGLGIANPASMMGLPRLDTSSIPSGLSSGLRTAPPFGGFPTDFDFDMGSYEGGDSDTVNPHELHTPGLQGLASDGHPGLGTSYYPGLLNSQVVADDDGNFEWITQGFDHQMSFMGAENAVESSPSAMDTNSPANFQEPNGVKHGYQPMHQPHKVDNMWHMSTAAHQQDLSSPTGVDVNSLFTDVPASLDHTISPKTLLAHGNVGYDMYFTGTSGFSQMDTTNPTNLSNSPFVLPFKRDNIPSTASTTSVDSSMRHSSVTTNCSELVTEHMRSSIMASLSQCSSFGRRQSMPVVSSPLTPGGSTKAKGFNASTFPSTADLQRYASAYFRFCHPHLPFLHVATLNFESPEYASSWRSSGSYSNYGQVGNFIGGSCLLLSVAAMGALYENESNVSRELFEYAKRTISNYLEGRRKSNVSRTMFASHHQADNEDTPLWLVQAMLLNVVYGHNCGDKTAADIASNHCAALVSLARGAELAKPYPNLTASEAWMSSNQDSIDSEWLEWKILEERKRTLYSIFVLSSMLVMAYNRPPALTNSEIRLDLPCDEELWAAESAHAWRALGGNAAVRSRAIPFAGALTHLLTTAQREKQAMEQNYNTDSWHQHEIPNSVLKPSSFGCLVLINALHNYIWETRQRHLGRQWTPQEVEAMHAHIEPALRAWSTAWSSNPLHVIERPNPFGAGPLPADSIPLLDLAYVRLFVDFGRSKEAYWQRDYDSMAQELAKGPETGYVGNAGRPDGMASPNGHEGTPESSMGSGFFESSGNDRGEMLEYTSKPTRRERHLRKAAFYAADHLINADRLGMAFVEKTSRDLPMQSVLCACDSAQVLSEWVTTLQERVGKYVGMLGIDNINLNEVPAVLLLDEEDRKLLGRVEELLISGEQKSDNLAALHEGRQGGYGSRVLLLTSQTMARAAVWPVTKLMSQSLEIQAGHVSARVLNSVSHEQILVN